MLKVTNFRIRKSECVRKSIDQGISRTKSLHQMLRKRTSKADDDWNHWSNIRGIISPSMRRFFAALSMVAPIAVLPSVEAKDVRVYSGRHYNTDRAAYKRFSEETGIKVRLIEATGISLVERLKREEEFKGDVILLVDAARINNAAEAGLLQPYPRKNSSRMFLHAIGIIKSMVWFHEAR